MVLTIRTIHDVREVGQSAALQNMNNFRTALPVRGDQLVQLPTVTVLLLLVTFLLSVGVSAYLTYLVVDANITQPMRDDLIDAVRGPSAKQYQDDMERYRASVQAAMDAGDAIPVDAPQPPEDPALVELLRCRWCAALWVSAVVAVVARMALVVPYYPIWWGLPWHPLDFLIVPAWALACAYAVGWFASKEGD